MKSNVVDSIHNLFKESNIQAADPTLLSDFDALGTNFKDISNEIKNFKARE